MISFYFQTIEVLSMVPAPDLALRLYLECAEVCFYIFFDFGIIYLFLFLFLTSITNDCDLEPVAYEFFTQAYILYEEEISVNFLIFILFHIFEVSKNSNVSPFICLL